MHRLTGLLIVNFVLSAGLIIAFIVQIEQQNPTESIQLFMAHIFANTLCLGICWLVSRKHLKFIELSGSTLSGSGLIVTVIFCHFELVEMDSLRYLTAFTFAFFNYLLYTGLLSTQFWKHVIPRIIWYIVSLTVIAVFRWKKESNASLPALAFLTTGILIVEILFFVQEKAQVRLFMASKVIELQEK